LDGINTHEARKKL
jgi:hypothetical protein